MFEYYDSGDQRWIRRKNELLEDDPDLTIRQWLEFCGYETRDCNG